MWCRLSTPDNNELLIGNCYCSPAASNEERDNLHKVVKTAARHQCIIMGDFNHPSIDWNTLEADNTDTLFLDLVQDCYLHQHVDTPTRGENTLDLILSSEINMVANLQVMEHLGTSDHNMIKWDLVCSVTINDNER